MPSVLDQLSSTVDRFQEAHFFLHQMEGFYHSADPFRYSLNSFIRALKEVAPMISMEMQNRHGFADWYRPVRTSLYADPLINHFAEQRDFIVHRGMLKPHSKGIVGITEGRGIKLGFTIPIDPLEDSDDAMRRVLWATRSGQDFLMLRTEDEDSLPCVQREWRLPGFDDEIIDLCANAWLRVGQTLVKVVEWSGESAPPMSLDCRHSKQRVQFELYERDTLRGWLNEMKSAHAQSRKKKTRKGKRPP